MKAKRVLVLSFFIVTYLTTIISATPAFCQTPKPEEALQYKLTADDHLRKGETSLSIQEYEKALTLDPSSTALCFNLAVAHFTNKNSKGAISALEKLVELDPQDVEAHYNLTCLYLAECNLPKAKYHIEKAKLCCDRDRAFTPLVEQSSAFVSEVEKLDPVAQRLIFLLVHQDLWSTTL